MSCVLSRQWEDCSSNLQCSVFRGLGVLSWGRFTLLKVYIENSTESPLLEINHQWLVILYNTCTSIINFSLCCVRNLSIPFFCMWTVRTMWTVSISANHVNSVSHAHYMNHMNHINHMNHMNDAWTVRTMWTRQTTWTMWTMWTIVWVSFRVSLESL